MQHNERGPQQSSISNAQPPIAERVARVPERAKEKSVVERMSTTVLDIGRDIVTANKKAMDNFDGKSPLLVAAQGGATALVGIGLEKVLDKTFKKGMEGGTLYFGKLQIDIPKEVADQIKGFERSHPRWHHFILQSTKDLLTGTIYNGLAFFSRPMFESAKAEHLVGSLAVNASEAMFTKGLKSVLVRQSAVDKKAAIQSERDVWQNELTERAKLRTESALTAQANAKDKLNDLDEQLNKFIIPDEEAWAWQSFLRQFTTFSNPATLLGLDMLGRSMIAFKDNLVEVRKTRKDKGIVGKSVDMEKKYEKKEWGNRDSGGRWQGNKDKVYYGKSNWKSADQKAQEEYELKAG